ncbi:MAG TPA: hypothetical protein DCQ26_15665 [Marinilabiliales bacterium]|nr:MAG: hypothetical protein A2W84_01680 [Bacteroidetes bacterium GWC2_40_13]OFX73847.1 MAG: hypothetical protein A2W96_19460 [Bacteroidetes bacterium GWD2_40_43]OFX91173.1 MAG: hypothetical protein A2W97_14550 [Bacteroidetes bacterium GWE2_40_63]OFY22849.1 MAG: hypothetical protein A2W88_08645 [Bacteroidetes bacterium GWF2_40_13]OFZ25881.1 MAG: hypothetical protein A2437_16885 [Bacteroidetes bacterium RIFOXYC2_FULL_40_12]HAN00037.1 hypothetical protein [Marinilabiliales bacterium]
MKTIRTLILLFGFIAGIQTIGLSQCKTFTKNDCKPKLDPYIYNGQLNSAVLNEGDFAELMLTFYSNQDYRIMVCAAGELGKVVFRLVDTEGQVVFTNEDHGMIDYWDFRTKSTQQLVIEVSVPESTKEGELAKSGCVSILVGFLDNQ